MNASGKPAHKQNRAKLGWPITMRIETAGRSGVPHFARRFCLLARHTCDKNCACNAAAILFFSLPLPLSCVFLLRFRRDYDAIEINESHIRAPSVGPRSLETTPERERSSPRRPFRLCVTDFIFHADIHFNGHNANDASRTAGASVVKSPADSCVSILHTGCPAQTGTSDFR